MINLFSSLFLTYKNCWLVNLTVRNTGQVAWDRLATSGTQSGTQYYSNSGNALLTDSTTVIKSVSLLFHHNSNQLSEPLGFRIRGLISQFWAHCRSGSAACWVNSVHLGWMRPTIRGAMICDPLFRTRFLPTAIFLSVAWWPRNRFPFTSLGQQKNAFARTLCDKKATQVQYNHTLGCRTDAGRMWIL